MNFAEITLCVPFHIKVVLELCKILGQFYCFHRMQHSIWGIFSSSMHVKTLARKYIKYVYSASKKLMRIPLFSQRVRVKGTSGNSVKLEVSTGKNHLIQSSFGFTFSASGVKVLSTIVHVIHRRKFLRPPSHFWVPVEIINRKRNVIGNLFGKFKWSYKSHFPTGFRVYSIKISIEFLYQWKYKFRRERIK